MHHAINFERVGMAGVILAERANAVIGEKFIGGKHPAQQLLHTLAAHQGEQVALTGIGLLLVRDQAHQVWPVGQILRQVIVETGQGFQ